MSKKIPEPNWDAVKKLMDDMDKHLKGNLVEVVRCRDCKYRIVNEHYGEKGYMRIKAMCKFESDIFELGRRAEEDDWFCADGERNDT